jgi:hypothetical protein
MGESRSATALLRVRCRSSREDRGTAAALRIGSRLRASGRGGPVHTRVVGFPRFNECRPTPSPGPVTHE